MMTTTQLHQGQHRQLDNGNNAITMRATTLLQQRQRRLDCKDACTFMMATPLQQGG
jgi:hypothetical protein